MTERNAKVPKIQLTEREEDWLRKPRKSDKKAVKASAQRVRDRFTKSDRR